ncbi:hypothetical protein DB459_00400 [Bradyrhizobium sp. WD16]|nr:hypothetical protein DB459_00400 [Bradyrhizobium sp. WD16]
MLEVYLMHAVGENISDAVYNPKIIARRLLDKPDGIGESYFGRCRGQKAVLSAAKKTALLVFVDTHALPDDHF